MLQLYEDTIRGNSHHSWHHFLPCLPGTMTFCSNTDTLAVARSAMISAWPWPISVLVPAGIQALRPDFSGKPVGKQEEYESVLFHAVAFIMLSSEGKSFLEEESDVLFQVKYSSIAFPVSDMRFRSCRLTQMSEVAEDSEKVRKFCSTSAPLSIGRFKHIAKKRSVTWKIPGTKLKNIGKTEL